MHSTMSEQLFVIKRDGSRQPVSFDQILARITKLSENLEHVNPTIVTQKICNQLFDGIKTSELDNFAAETCAMMQTRNHPNYGVLAARISISNHTKNTPDYLEGTMILRDADVVTSEYFDIVDKHISKLQEMMDYSRDYLLDYFGFKTLEYSYLLKANKRIIERPQHLWMRVAIQLHGDNLTRVRETYDALSLGYFIHATPTLFNSSTKMPQLSSCFLMTMDSDSIDGIFKTISDCAQISKWAGGIGVSVHDIRARGSLIKGTNGESSGLVPMLKVFNSTAKYVNQGGKRNGSFAIYLEPWHSDIEDFLRLKLNQGSEDERSRDLFYGLWIPDLFMNRVDRDEMWTLMCPNECPGLSDCWGSEFEKLYTRYESERPELKRISARKLWEMILDTQIQTGTPYLCYKDAANSKSNQQNLGTIKSSNLCSEIIEYTSPTETAVCNLGSLALPKFIENGAFNFSKLREYTRILTINLNIVIDKTYYPTIEGKNSNMRNRPIGIGVQGLADVFAMLKIAWTSKSALDLNREIFENIYYASVQASCDGCEEWHGMTQGAYSSFTGSPVSIGKLQFDLWKEKPTHTPYLDWNMLKQRASLGMRNSLLIAPMPTASTSQILGNNECFEPFTSNIYVRRVLSGEFMLINKHLVRDLHDLNLWNQEIRTSIIADNGSIQNIPEIPQELREIYKTAWEIPQKTIIDLAAGRAPFICQSQSLNLFVKEPTYSKLSSMHFYAWRKGLKTGCYYLRTKPKSAAQKFTIEPEKSQECVTCSA